MEEHDKKFEAYFNRKMSAIESLDFQTALEANAQLESDYQFYVSIKRATAEIKRDEIRNKLDDIHINELPNEEKNPKRKNTTAKIFTLIKIGSAIAALFIIAMWGYNDAKSNKKPDLFAQNFEVFVAQSSRGDISTNHTELYDNGNYEAFTNQADDLKQSSEIKLMLANSYLLMDKIELAISSLNKISDDSSFREQKYWYLGLANLKNKNLTAAKKHFTYLQSISNYKKQEIDEILFKINK